MSMCVLYTCEGTPVKLSTGQHPKIQIYWNLEHGLTLPCRSLSPSQSIQQLKLGHLHICKAFCSNLSFICSFPSKILLFNVSVTAKGSATAGTERGQPGQQVLAAIQLPVAELQMLPEIGISSQEQPASTGWEIQGRRRDPEPDRQYLLIGAAKDLRDLSYMPMFVSGSFQ